jgi:hypothetical protein
MPHEKICTPGEERAKTANLSTQLPQTVELSTQLPQLDAVKSFAEGDRVKLMPLKPGSTLEPNILAPDGVEGKVYGAPLTDGGKIVVVDFPKTREIFTEADAQERLELLSKRVEIADPKPLIEMSFDELIRELGRIGEAAKSAAQVSAYGRRTHELTAQEELALAVIGRLKKKNHPAIERERYLDALIGLSLSFPDNIDASRSTESNSRPVIYKTDEELESLFDFYKRTTDDMDLEFWGALKRHMTPPGKMLSRMKSEMPIVIKPIKSMKDLFKLQAEMGGDELHISVFNPPGAEHPLLLLTRDLESVSSGRFKLFLAADGHTHGYSIPLEASGKDKKSAILKPKKTTDFILGFSQEGRVEMALYGPKKRDYVYEHEDQEKIETKLREFGVLK